MSDLLRVLETFRFPGITEHFHDHLPPVFPEIGVPGACRNQRVAGAGDRLQDLDMGRETFPVRRGTDSTDDFCGGAHKEHPKDVRLYRFLAARRRRPGEEHGWK